MSATMEQLNLSPFVYHAQRLRLSCERLMTPAMQGCFVLWRCKEGVVELQRDTEHYRLVTGDMALVEAGFAMNVLDRAALMRCSFDLQSRERHLGSDDLPVACSWEPQSGWQELLGKNIPAMLPKCLTVKARETLDRIFVHHLEGWAGRMKANALLGLWLADYLIDIGASPKHGKRQLQNDSQDLASCATRRMHELMAHISSIDDLAAQFRVSRRSLTAAFRKAHDTTPAAYLAQLRLERAKAWLRDDRDNLAKIARGVGLSEPGLRKLFHRYEGYAPREWIRRQL